MKVSQKGFILHPLLVFMVILLISGGAYVVYKNNSYTETVYMCPDGTIQFGGSDCPKSIAQSTSTVQIAKDLITIQSIQGNVVIFRIIGNSEQSCTRHEYKIDFGDGKNEYLDIPKETCAKKETTFSHMYQSIGTFTARLHNLTGISYYEPAFDQVENPVASVAVQITSKSQ